MLKQKLDFEETEIKKPKKQNIRIIDDMNSAKIVSHLIYKHRVGLLITSNLSFVVMMANNTFKFIY